MLGEEEGSNEEEVDDGEGGTLEVVCHTLDGDVVDDDHAHDDGKHREQREHEDERVGAVQVVHLCVCVCVCHARVRQCVCGTVGACVECMECTRTKAEKPTRMGIMMRQIWTAEEAPISIDNAIWLFNAN